MNFSKKQIVVLGDLMIDEYVYGSCSRISGEAPVPIVKIESTEYKLGGAGNVAANISDMGGNPILIGTCGNDKAAVISRLFHAHEMSQKGLVLADKPTTTKTRIVANRQQIARIDSECTAKPTYNEWKSVENRIKNVFSDTENTVGAVVISDYAKGVVTLETLQEAIYEAHVRKIPVFLDPKLGQNELYYGFAPGAITVMTPNSAEAEDLAGRKITNQVDLECVGRQILLRYNAKYVLITRGEQGMTLFSGSESGLSADIAVNHIPTAAKSVFDVSGAGDTVIATIALAYVSGSGMKEAAEIANIAAGIVVGKPGTATCSAQELLTATYKANAYR